MKVYAILRIGGKYFFGLFNYIFEWLAIVKAKGLRINI